MICSAATKIGVEEDEEDGQQEERRHQAHGAAHRVAVEHHAEAGQADEDGEQEEERDGHLSAVRAARMTTAVTMALRKPSGIRPIQPRRISWS